MGKVVRMFGSYGSGMCPVPVADAFRTSTRCSVRFGLGDVRGGFVFAREAWSWAVMRASVSSILGFASGLVRCRVVGLGVVGR